MKAFNSDAFSHQGKHYTIPPDIPYRGYDLKEVTLVPRPRTQPVDVWQPIVSASDRALDFMAKWGIKGVILGTGEQYVDEWVHRYQAANRRAGRDLALGEGLCIGLWGHGGRQYPPAPAASWSRCSRNTSSSPPRWVCSATATSKIAATGPGGVAPPHCRRHQLPGCDRQPSLVRWKPGGHRSLHPGIAGQVPGAGTNNDCLPHGRHHAAVQGPNGPVRRGGDAAFQEGSGGVGFLPGAIIHLQVRGRYDRRRISSASGSGTA